MSDHVQPVVPAAGVRFSRLIPSYMLDPDRARFKEGDTPRLPFGVHPMPADLWTTEDDKTLVKVYDGIGQDHNGQYYRSGVLIGGYPVKVHVEMGGAA